MRPMRLASPLISLALLAVPALAQTAAPATPAPTTAKPAQISLATNRTVSGVAISVSRAAAGQLVSCPSKLKVSRQAVCLYSKQPAAQVRTQIRSTLGSQALGDWKLSGTSGSLLVKDTAGQAGAYVLSTPLSAQETLLVVDAVTVPAASKPAAPAGVVRGQPYLLGKDLIGVVNVVSLGGGKFRLNVAGETPLTVTAGQKTAQREGGNVDLPLAPASDGKNLIFPLSGLRALGCTVTDAPKGVTITCGSDSVGVLPIVF
uniref:hypothetical protein n=1 Tax=Deinococcus sp. VB142 TaxID=3112952 RepID=UPI00403F059D